ncbi:hypothetical protein [Aeromicrobium sp. 9AM]|uniref:hypothetical protein n=1 Tax=Aeromicrobium sp. 9AM TaxID=2653126 RepID=UPI0012F2F095|nr:hypothetical protein [Aeromicrobium sp. 9AM]VXC07849.1 conserved hypothetical protein [Aeromicrobium sp. 9AM]
MSRNAEWIAKTRVELARLLRDIPNLCLELHWEARARHSDRIFPGGRPLDMMAPASTPSRWEQTYEQLESMRWDEGVVWEDIDYAPDQRAEDDHHPLYVMASWTEIIREERDQPTDLKPTISRCVDYLKGSIDWCLRTDEHGDMEWLAIDQMLEDLEGVKRAMENVLIVGLRAERTRVNCTQEKCDAKPRLIKIYGAQARWDEYKCPGCGDRYTPSQYEAARSKNFRTTGTMEKFISVDLAKSSIDADRRTFWSWMDRLQTRAVCDIKTRRVMVWWPVVYKLDLDRQDRALKARLKKLKRSA